jgi:hypothetical protein
MAETTKKQDTVVFEILNDKQLTFISTSLGVSESVLNLAVQNAKKGIDAGYIPSGTGMIKISSLSASTDKAIKTASIATKGVKVISKAGHIFLVVDVAQNSINGIVAASEGKTSKAIASGIKVGISMATTAGTAANPLLGAAIGVGVYLVDCYGMEEGESRIEKIVDGLIQARNKDASEVNGQIKSNLVSGISATVNNNFSLQNQRTGSISTLTNNTDSTLVLGAAQEGASIYASCINKVNGEFDNNEFLKLRREAFNRFADDKVYATLHGAYESVDLQNAFKKNFDKGVAVAKDTITTSGTNNLDRNIKLNILARANQGDWFVSTSNGKTLAKINGGNGSKILPIGVTEAKAQQQTNKPKVQSKIK